MLRLSQQVLYLGILWIPSPVLSGTFNCRKHFNISFCNGNRAKAGPLFTHGWTSAAIKRLVPGGHFTNDPLDHCRNDSIEVVLCVFGGYMSIDVITHIFEAYLIWSLLELTSHFPSSGDHQFLRKSRQLLDYTRKGHSFQVGGEETCNCQAGKAHTIPLYSSCQSAYSWIRWHRAWFSVWKSQM